jgi:hypothetical protein
LQPRLARSAKAFLLATALLVLPLSAHAMFIHDLTVTGNFSGNGQIELDSAAGNTLANVVAFSFTVTSSAGGLPTPTVFTRSDISSLSWSGADSTLALILRSALVGPLGLVLKANDQVLVDDMCGALGSNSGSTYCTTNGPILVGNSTLTTSQVVPEPGTLALFGVGLLGLFWARRTA